jgi:hypothetical protein
VIVKHGKKWLLITSTRTYEHATREEAERQERAISMSKARRAGRHIPKAPHRHRR